MKQKFPFGINKNRNGYKTSSFQHTAHNVFDRNKTSRSLTPMATTCGSRNHWIFSYIIRISVFGVSLVGIVPTWGSAISTKTGDSPAVEKRELSAEEKALKELWKRMKSLEEKVSQAQPSSSKPKEITTIPNAKPVLCGLNAEVYGYARVDMAYDSHTTDTVDMPKYPLPRTPETDASKFNIHARETRLGLNIGSTDIDQGKVTANLEGDFYKDTFDPTNETLDPGKYSPRLRHAYIKWEKDRWALLAGQTADVLNPIGCNMLNHDALGSSGCLGDRHAQFRATYRHPLEKQGTLIAEAAVVRPEKSWTGIPHFQYNLAYEAPFFCEKNSLFSISGVCGREKSLLNKKRYAVWGVVGGISAHLHTWLAISGNLFTGANLSSYCGSIDHIPNEVLNKNIHSSGGWVQVSFTPTDAWEWNTGIGMECCRLSDLPNYMEIDEEHDPVSSASKRNMTIFTNVIYHFTASFWIGAELSHMRIAYKGNKNADKNNRMQLAATYKF